MPLFTTSPPTRSGVFAQERVPPTFIRGGPTGIAALVGQFPWGPGAIGVGSLQTFTFAQFADLLKMYCPDGMSRAGSAALMALAFSFPTLKIVRVIGTGSATATVTINKTGPTALVVANGKYIGVAGNSIVVTTSAASDADANHFDLTASVTNGLKTTTEIFRNLNVSGVGTDRLPSSGNADPSLNLDNFTLLGSVTKSASGVPILQAWNLATGSDGAIAAAQYTGTAGTGDAGIAKLESDTTIRHVITDDPGNSIRASVNAGLKTHAESLLDRVAYLSGNSGQTAATAQTDAASYISTNVVYTGPWVQVYDDNRQKVFIPPQAAAVSMASNLSPSTAIMWRDSSALRYLGNILGVDVSWDGSAGANTLAGISSIVPFLGGGFCFEVGKVTINKSTPSKGNLTRTLMGIYIASSVVAALQSNVGAPNVKLNQQDVVNAIDTFLDTLKRQQFKDPNNNPFILNYRLADPVSVNAQADLDAGQYTVAADIKTAAAMEKIIFSVNYGETVQITAS